MVIMRESTARRLGATPLARIVAHTQHAQEPGWFTTAPVGAMQKLFAKTGWGADDVDLYEINEAFAVVTMAAMTDLKLAHEKVNIHGGATALGHPIGPRGPRRTPPLVAPLAKHSKRRRQGKAGGITLESGG